MKRLSNRIHPATLHQAQQVQHVDRIIEAPAVHTHSTVEVEKLVYVQSEPVDHSSLKEWTQNRVSELNTNVMLCFQDHKDLSEQKFNSLKTELEMQRQALVAIRMQRNIDRKRRLQLILRLKEYRAKDKANKFKVKLAIAAGLLISIASLIVKL